MPNTVFFSWQADTPTKVGRYLVERALERAASRLGEDTNVEEAIRELSVDRDTKDVPGSPPIVDTILRKIDKAAVFVPDLTFVGTRLDGRPAPNPNVLIEYGWALKSLGHGRIVPVMNAAFGEPSADTMPFNLHHLRNPILYHCPATADEDTRRDAREKLSRKLELAIRTVFGSEEFRSNSLSVAKPSEFIPRQPTERVGRFRRNGEPLGVADGIFGDQNLDVYLAEEPVIWLRMMPKHDPGRTWLVTELRRLATSGQFLLLPLNTSWSSYSYLRHQDGFGVYVPAKEEDGKTTPGVVFAFASGEIWSVDAYLLDALVRGGHHAVPDVEDFLTSAVKSYSMYLARLGVKPPYRWIAGMENLLNRTLSPRSDRAFFTRGSKCLLDVVTEEGIHDPSVDAKASLAPFFTKLFDACGLERHA